MGIETMLVATTGHLTEATCNGFLPTWAGSTTIHRETGWIIYVPSRCDEPSGESFARAPADLVRVLSYARDLECVWLMLDCDAPAAPGLPTYEW